MWRRPLTPYGMMDSSSNCLGWSCQARSLPSNRRTIAVRVGNSVSRQVQLHAGMPQGSVWSPLFFNIIVIDIPFTSSSYYSLLMILPFSMLAGPLPREATDSFGCYGFTWILMLWLENTNESNQVPATWFQQFQRIQDSTLWEWAWCHPFWHSHPCCEGSQTPWTDRHGTKTQADPTLLQQWSQSRESYQPTLLCQGHFVGCQCAHTSLTLLNFHSSILETSSVANAQIKNTLLCFHLQRTKHSG